MITYRINKEKVKQIFNFVVIIFTATIVLAFAIFTQGLEELINNIKSLNHWWILIAISFMFICWGIEAIIFHKLALLFHSKQKLKVSIRATMIGQFFNAVTPFASGGQPAQLYYMIKSGIDGGASTSILTIKFILFQSIYILYSIVIVIFKFSFFKEYLSNLLYVSMIGFIVNISLISFIIIVATNKKVAKFILIIFLRVLQSIRIIKSTEKVREKVDKELNSFHENIIIICNNLNIMIKTALLTMLQLITYSSITYLIYRSFNLEGSSLWNIVSAQTFLTMITSIIPLPGASGGSEGGFYLFFKMFFTNSNIVSAMILWRMITYYLTIIVGSFFTAK